MSEQGRITMALKFLEIAIPSDVVSNHLMESSPSSLASPAASLARSSKSPKSSEFETYLVHFDMGGFFERMNDFCIKKRCRASYIYPGISSQAVERQAALLKSLHT